jgi:peptidoglycan/xylan/chitin deacetylase (PgdA/CDA1 family)
VAAFASLLSIGAALPPRPVILTFDDGHGDFASQALPLLERYGLGATLYVTTTFMGGSSPWQHRRGQPPQPMLSWDELRAICDMGIECAAHGLTHEPLDTLPRTEARREIVESKHTIENQLGRQVATFSYPHGRYDTDVRAMVAGAGYIGACSTTRAMSNDADDRYSLARIPVAAGTTVAQFARLLEGDGLPLAPIPERLRTRAWRKARQVARAVRARRTTGGAAA